MLSYISTNFSLRLKVVKEPISVYTHLGLRPMVKPRNTQRYGKKDKVEGGRENYRIVEGTEKRGGKG